MPAPGMNYAPTHSTSTLPPPPTGGATTVNLGPVTPAAPLGVPTAPHQQQYVQDTSAQEMSAAQRVTLEEQERREGVFANVNLGVGGDKTGGVIGTCEGEGVVVGETVGSAWSAVKSFVGTAGEKLAEVEEEAWKRINGK